MQYLDKSIKSLADLKGSLEGVRNPVLLLEGTREVAKEDESLLKSMGRMLAERFPSVVFRSGNAKGSDTLFARGVESVDAERMEYVLPYERMGSTRRARDGVVKNLGQLSRAAETAISEFTVAATPEYERLIQYYMKHGRMNRTGAKAVYLMRDSLKVVGSDELDKTVGPRYSIAYEMIKAFSPPLRGPYSRFLGFKRASKRG